MNYLIDAVLLVIIVLCIIRSAKKGFVRSLVEAVGLVIALLLAVSCGNYAAQTIYDSSVRPAISSTIEKSFTDATNNALDQLPSFFKQGLDAADISIALDETASDAALRVTDTVVKPIAYNLINSVATVIVFIVLAIVVRFIASFINTRFRGVIFGTANKLLGGCVGAVKGVAIAIVLCYVASFLVSIMGNEASFITSSDINNSYFARTIFTVFNILF